jgi:phage terminase large subunit GpA-like protein
MIEQIYSLGDERKWYIKCPRCNEQIILEFRPIDETGKKIVIGKKQTGLIFDMENSSIIPDSVMYCCQICGDYFYEKEKHRSVKKGKWLPTKNPKRAGCISWGLNRLYAPEGQAGWLDICQKYAEAMPDGRTVNVEKYKTFRQTIEGLPFELIKSSINILTLIKHVRNYDVGTVPEDLSIKDGNGQIIMITFACDLNGKLEDARVDWEIVAHSRSGTTYSIDMGSVGTFVPYIHRQKFTKEQQSEYENNRIKFTYEFYQDNNVWDIIKEIASQSIKFDNGKTAEPLLAAVDVSFGHSDDLTGEQRATTFVQEQEGLPVFLGFKGIGVGGNFSVHSQFLKQEKRHARHFILDVNALKFELQSRLNLKWNPQTMDRQPAGFANFPTPSDGKYGENNYFRHFSSERTVLAKDGRHQEWQKIDGRDNHFWDVNVYHLALQKFAIQDWWENIPMGGGKSPKSLGVPPTWENFCKYSIGIDSE